MLFFYPGQMKVKCVSFLGFDLFRILLDFDTFFAVKYNLEYWHVYWIFEWAKNVL